MLIDTKYLQVLAEHAPREVSDALFSLFAQGDEVLSFERLAAGFAILIAGEQSERRG